MDCQYCGKVLKGLNNDWKGRRYHKMCYRKLSDLQTSLNNYSRVDHNVFKI